MDPFLGAVGVDGVELAGEAAEIERAIGRDGDGAAVDVVEGLGRVEPFQRPVGLQGEEEAGAVDDVNGDVGGDRRRRVDGVKREVLPLGIAEAEAETPTRPRSRRSHD